MNDLTNKQNTPVISRTRLRAVANQRSREVETEQFDKDILFLNALAKSAMYEKELKEKEDAGMSALQKLEALVKDSRRRLGLIDPPKIDIVRDSTPPPAEPASTPEIEEKQLVDIYNHPTTLLGMEAGNTGSANTYVIEYRSREVNAYLALTGAVVQHIENTRQLPEAIVIPGSMLPRYRAKIEEIQGYYAGLFFFSNQAIAIRTENELPKWVSLIISGAIPRDFLYTVSRDLPVKRIS